MTDPPNPPEAGPASPEAQSGGVAGLAQDAGDVYHKAHALTVLTPIRPGWSGLVRLVLMGMRSLPSLSVALKELSFIHYAHWAIVKQIPEDGQPQNRRNLHYDYLLFESNFDGSFEAYIEAFSEVLGDRLRLIWGSSFGFPGTRPLQPFLDYIHRNELVADYYWSATPMTRSTNIVAALKLRKRFATFAGQARYMDPATFQRAYQEFVGAVQLLI